MLKSSPRQSTAYALALENLKMIIRRHEVLKTVRSARGPACGEGALAPEAARSIPHGNHGDNLRSASK
jgi:hypothetical protein